MAPCHCRGITPVGLRSPCATPRQWHITKPNGRRSTVSEVLRPLEWRLDDQVVPGFGQNQGIVRRARFSPAVDEACQEDGQVALRINSI